MKANKLILPISILVLTILSVFMYLKISINDEANTRLVNIEGLKSSVEIKLDELHKVISENCQVLNGEKEAFMEFQRLVSDTKKGQTITGIMTQVQETYPNFEVKGYENLMQVIEIERKEFSVEQMKLNDNIAQYNQYIVKTINSYFLDSQKHKNMKQFVISTNKVKQSMETELDDEIKLGL